MSTHPGMLIAYDEDGNVVGSLAYMVRFDADGVPGLVDFMAHEEAGGEMADVWRVDVLGLTVKGSKVWPEYLSNPTSFRVELAGLPGRKRITSLVHRKSGHRRERAAIDAAINGRLEERRAIARKQGTKIRAELRRLGATTADAGKVQDPPPAAADISDLVGGPDMPLAVNGGGRTVAKGDVNPPPPLPIARR